MKWILVAIAISVSGSAYAQMCWELQRTCNKYHVNCKRYQEECMNQPSCNELRQACELEDKTKCRKFLQVCAR